MEFLTDAQRECYERVAPWMQELFGEQHQVIEDSPVFGVMLGSAFAMVQVTALGDDETIISARAYVVSGAELKPDLLLFLLQQNETMRFGSFGIDEGGDIVLQHAEVGSSCTKVELQEMVMAVVSAADLYDDQIVEQWGGKRALD